MDHKGRSKREAVWNKFCDENKLDKDARASRHLRKGHSHEVGPGEPQLTERQKGSQTHQYPVSQQLHKLGAKAAHQQDSPSHHQ